MGFFDIFKGKKRVVTENERREFLLRNGRITDGAITDAETTAGGAELVYYIYNLQGVDFESSEILSKEQMQNPLEYAPGAKVGIRFDPKNHGNSMLV